MKNEIRRELVAEDVPGLIDASQAAYAAFRCTFPGGMLHDEPGLMWFETGVPVRYFNGVLRTEVEEDELPATIERVMTYFEGRGLPFEWNIGPSSRPLHFEAPLLARGMVRDEDELGMAADLYALNEEIAPVPGLVIKEVASDEQLQQWSHTWGSGGPPWMGKRWYTLYKGLRLGADSPAHLYLGLLNGEPVATAALFFALGVAAIHHVATIERVRRMGIGAAMTLKAAQEARRHGSHIAILTASSLGVGIYRRLGFRQYCTFSTYSSIKRDMVPRSDNPLRAIPLR